MLEVWNWILAWIIGWGGIGLAVCIATWIAWWFSPVFKNELLHVAIGVTIFLVASTYFFTKGWDAALAAVAAGDQAAVDRVTVGVREIAVCRSHGGTWDVTTGTCR